MESQRTKIERVMQIVDKWPIIDRSFKISTSEFFDRRYRVWKAISQFPYNADVGFVFSDEHYSGDVPYLFGNINVSIEQVAGALGPHDLGKSGIVAGFEGVYVSGQLAEHGGTRVYPTESLQLADEKYPVEGLDLESILTEIAGTKPKTIALMTPRQVIPEGVVRHLEEIVGGPKSVIDAQLPYQQIKNLKSDDEMRLLQDASTATSMMVRAMLAVLEPDMLETEVAAYGDFVAKLWGLERFGFPTMVCSDEANVSMIGPCLNRPIQDGAFMHIGASGKRDGLTACCRRSVVCSSRLETPYMTYWRDLVEEAFRVGYDNYVDVTTGNKSAKLQEQSLVDYFNDHTDSALEKVASEYGGAAADTMRHRLFEDIPGLPQGLSRMKPYTGTHNAGYTECQEFYGAITLESDEPLDFQVVTMLDVALRGRGRNFNDIIIPGFDYFVVEDTLGKQGETVTNMTGTYVGLGKEQVAPGKLPINVQVLIGNAA